MRHTAPAPSRLIDVHAAPYDVSNSHSVVIDAYPATVFAGLDQAAIAGSVAPAFDLLGGAGRIAVAPGRLVSAGGRERLHGLAWRVDGRVAERVPLRALGAFHAPGYVKVMWDVRVQGDGDSGTALSTTVRFTATDDTSRERLRSAWGLVGPIAGAVADRYLRAVKRYALEHEEPVAGGSRVLLPVPAAPPRIARAA